MQRAPPVSPPSNGVARVPPAPYHSSRRDEERALEGAVPAKTVMLVNALDPEEVRGAVLVDGELAERYVETRARGGKVCMDCRWLKGPGGRSFSHLTRAAEEGLIKMMKTATHVMRQPFYSRRKKCWVHVLDDSCSLWEPPQKPSIDPMILSRFRTLCQGEGLQFVEAMEELTSLALRAGSISFIIKNRNPL